MRILDNSRLHYYLLGRMYQNRATILVMKNSTVFIVLLILGACANIPDLGALTQPREDLTSSATTDEAQTNYPVSEWWKAYGDLQLDGSDG